VIKRTIEISQEPAYLSVRLNQLQIRRGGQLVGSVPCEDIGVLVVDQAQTTYSHAALAQLAEADATVVVCGRNHAPVAVLLPLADHSEVVWRINDQISASKPVQKQLWKQLIQAKLRAQAQNLAEASPARSKLLALARQVRSGDPNNIEAQAARIYWSRWIPEEASFRRDQDGDGINVLLNYGYSVLRAAVARAVVVAGLVPSLGLKHCNRGNGLALADDLIEPVRPLVDARVRLLYQNQCVGLDPVAKSALLKILAEDVRFGGETGPLMVSLHRYVASLVRCLRGESRQLVVPVAIPCVPTAPATPMTAPEF